MVQTQPQSNKPKQITKKKKLTRYFEIYISKVLKKISPKSGITSNAKQQLNSVLCIIAKKISTTASRLTQIAKKKTVSVKELSNAIKLVLPPEVAKNALSEGNKAINKFIQETKTNNPEKIKNKSRHEKAGIIFPPSITEKFIRNFGFSNILVTKNTPIFLASALEYITSDILTVSTETTKENKRVRITVRDLELSVRTDEELIELFDTCNIHFLGGGVVPFIHESLKVKKPKRKKKKISVEHKGKKTHRFRPGTVALRDIKKIQKTSNCLLMPKHPFEKYTRSIITEYKSPIKISKGVFIILQYYIEQKIVSILRDSNLAAIHCNRVKLMPNDIEFIISLKSPQHYEFQEKSIKQPEIIVAVLDEREREGEEISS